jgi:hypothetical protein
VQTQLATVDTRVTTLSNQVFPTLSNETITTNILNTGTFGAVPIASSVTSGILASNDWTVFNNAAASQSNFTPLTVFDANSNAVQTQLATVDTRVTTLSNQVFPTLSNETITTNILNTGTFGAVPIASSVTSGILTATDYNKFESYSNVNPTWSNIVDRPTVLSGIASNDLTTFSSVITTDVTATDVFATNVTSVNVAASDLNVANVQIVSSVQPSLVLTGSEGRIRLVGTGGGGATVGIRLDPFDNGVSAQPSALIQAVDDTFSAQLELAIRPTGAGNITTPAVVVVRMTADGPQFPALPTSTVPPNVAVDAAGIMSRTTGTVSSISFLQSNLAANTTITGTNSYNTGIPLFLTIPAGTWMIIADVGAFISTTNQSTVLFRLFNDTAGAEIPASVTSVTQADGSLLDTSLNRGSSSCTRVVTLGVASVIRVQALASAGGSPSLLGSAANGFCRMTAIRLA